MNRVYSKESCVYLLVRKSFLWCMKMTKNGCLMRNYVAIAEGHRNGADSAR